MVNLQILHLGGPELDAGNLKARKNQLKALTPLLKKVECIVLCGNLTKAGDFTLLEEFLKLLELDKRPRQSILLAPGPTDPEEEFREFHERYYGAAHQAPTHDGLDVRSLRDIMLIAARFDNCGQVEDEAKAGTKHLCSLVEGRAEAWKDSGRQHKLRVLATAANPFETSSYLRLKDPERDIAALQQDIDLILCGPTDVSVVPPQPFSAMPAVIGASRRAAADQAALPFNVLELRLPPSPRPRQDRIQYSLRSYRSHLRPELPDYRYATSAFERCSSQIEDLLLCKQSLSPEIERFLKSEDLTLIEVFGYGHVWKSVIKEGLHSFLRNGAYAVILKAFELREYPDSPERPKDWLPSDPPLLEEIENWYGGLRPWEESTLVAVVIDKAYEGREHSSQLDEVKKRLVEKFGNALRIIYLCSSYGATLLDRKGMERLPLPPIASDTLDEFLDLAACEVPIQLEVFKRLTGGYVGFIDLLTAVLRKRFQRGRGGESDEYWRFDESVRHVCEVSPELREETRRFFDYLQNYLHGRDIAERFLARMREMKEEKEANLVSDDIFITFSSEELQPLKTDFERLIEEGVVRRADKQFFLQERIPFLVQILRPKPYLFLSCADEDRKPMEKLNRKLTTLGFECFYWRKANLDQIKPGLDGGIANGLALCDYVIVLWTDVSRKSGLVLDEARQALGEVGRRRLVNWFDGVTPAWHLAKQEAAAKGGTKMPERDKSGNLYCDELIEFNGCVEARSLAAVVDKVSSQLG